MASFGRFIFLLVLLTLALGALLAGGGYLLANQPIGKGENREVILEVQKGDAPNTILSRLKLEGVLTSPRLVYWTGRITRYWGKLKAGEYRIHSEMTALELLQTLTSGVSIFYPVTIREGDNMYQVADEIRKKGLPIADDFIKICESPRLLGPLDLPNSSLPTLEGYLFPDTYHITKIQTATDVIKEMLKRFKSAWKNEWAERARELNLTPHQVMTLASIIEKETGAAHERKLISSVFHNRLKKRMRLQSDPTTIYGIWKTFNGNLTRTDLKTATPYNTYAIPALPIGPIGNPGLEAIEAALFPATSEYLYFVSMNDGTHVFNSTLEGHNRAVREYQINRAAREGKSWRDLKKSKGP